MRQAARLRINYVRSVTCRASLQQSHNRVCDRCLVTWCRYHICAVCSYPRGSGIGLDLAEYGIGPNMKGKPLELGKSLLRRQGKDAALVGYGSSVNECLAAAEMLAQQGVEVTVCDARFCKPLDTAMVRLRQLQLGGSERALRICAIARCLHGDRLRKCRHARVSRTVNTQLASREVFASIALAYI